MNQHDMRGIEDVVLEGMIRIMNERPGGRLRILQLVATASGQGVVQDELEEREAGLDDWRDYSRPAPIRRVA